MLYDASHNEIWDRLRNGDRDALLSIYNNFYLGLVNYGLRISGDRFLTTGCITQVLLRLWDKHQSLPPVQNLRVYLSTCLRNEIFAELRSENTRLTRCRAVQRFFDESEPSYEECLIESQTNRALKEKLRKALYNLTAREKELIRLKFFEDLDYDEISAQCGITKRTAYNIIHTALKNLKAGFVISPDTDWVSDATTMILVGLLFTSFV
jgi:RNA polymerase sigma factor (sigma-70 family)